MEVPVPLKGIPREAFVEIDWAPLDRSCSPLDSGKASTPFILSTLVQILYRLIFRRAGQSCADGFSWPAHDDQPKSLDAQDVVGSSGGRHGHVTAERRAQRARRALARDGFSYSLEK